MSRCNRWFWGFGGNKKFAENYDKIFGKKKKKMKESLEKIKEFCRQDEKQKDESNE